VAKENGMSRALCCYLTSTLMPRYILSPSDCRWKIRLGTAVEGVKE